jgi:sugar phosphate isomerase/epimerase
MNEICRLLQSRHIAVVIVVVVALPPCIIIAALGRKQEVQMTAMQTRIVTSVAPYVTVAGALRATQLAYEDGFSGVEHNEDHLHCSVAAKPDCLGRIKEFSADRHMLNSLHKTLHRPSIDSPDRAERKKAVDYTLRTVDYMEVAGIPRMVLHSFSDLPTFFSLKAERANRAGYFVGCNVVKVYGILAPALKAYRQWKKEEIQANFMSSLSEIARYAADKKVDGGSRPIEIVFEEHYSDAIDYDLVPYGKGNFANVIRGMDTAHHLIRTGKDLDLDGMSEPIHFHAVDTNGWIDDHRTIGTGRVHFEKSLADAIGKNLADAIVLEDGTRKSALRSKEVLAAMIKRAGAANHCHNNNNGA